MLTFNHGNYDCRLIVNSSLQDPCLDKSSSYALQCIVKSDLSFTLDICITNKCKPHLSDYILHEIKFTIYMNVCVNFASMNLNFATEE